MAGLAVAACTCIIWWPGYKSEPNSSLGLAVAAALVNISFVWIPWNAELRAWRMLPMSRAQLGAAIVGFIAVSCLVPWVLVFTALGSWWVSQELITFNILFSLLGISVLVQGVALTLLPVTLKGSEVGIVRWVILLLTAIFVLSYGSFLLVVCKEMFQADVTSHGWMWMIAGGIALFAGIPIAARRAERVLRRDDCYQKATE
jgi:hypothetical protein